MTRIFAVVSQKGGVGKTSLVQNLGAELARAGHRVLLVDFDPQSNLTTGWGLDPGTAAGVLVYENVWAAPFAAALRHSGGQLVAAGHIPVQALVAALDALEGADQPVG